jgi:hypothetical protein
VKLGRNDICPCGSGRKVKRCCGVDALRDLVQLRAETAEELFELALNFPRYRPRTEEFDVWARAAPDEPSDEAIEQGLSALDAAERERILAGFPHEYPRIWEGMLADFGNDALAREIVLKGAVVAGVAERFQPWDESFPLLEDGGDDEGPIVALASSIRAMDVWSVIESGETAEALDALPVELGDGEYELRWTEVLEAELRKRWTAWHDERLDVLVARLRESLPDPDFPVASSRVLAACTHLDAVRRGLAAALLSDSLDRIYATA